MKKIFNNLVLLILPFLLSCTLASVNVEVMSERTALENQILGTYNSLDKEMLLLSSVRGVDSMGKINRPPKHTRDHQEAMNAMQIVAFHSDDLYAFKKLGWIGENNQGLLTMFPMQKENIPDEFKHFAHNYQKSEFSYVIKQLNQARETIFNRIIDLNENLSDSDLPKIRQISAKLNAENAGQGEKIQRIDGIWYKKNGE
jgi:hypothetical protein